MTRTIQLLEVVRNFEEHWNISNIHDRHWSIADGSAQMHRVRIASDCFEAVGAFARLMDT